MEMRLPRMARIFFSAMYLGIRALGGVGSQVVLLGKGIAAAVPERQHILAVKLDGAGGNPGGAVRQQAQDGQGGGGLAGTGLAYQTQALAVAQGQVYAVYRLDNVAFGGIFHHKVFDAQ